MKKIFGTLGIGCMFLFVVTCIVAQNVNSQWEKVDGSNIIGGLCYVFRAESKCPNYTATCANSSCSLEYGLNGAFYSCNGSGNIMKSKRREGWIPGADANESGTGVTAVQYEGVYCTKNEICEPHCAYYPIARIADGGGEWLCNAGDVTVSDPVIHYVSAPNSTSCGNQ
jgi:hypothetical protein